MKTDYDPAADRATIVVLVEALEACHHIAQDADTYEGERLSMEEVCMGAVNDIEKIARTALEKVRKS